MNFQVAAQCHPLNSRSRYKAIRGEKGEPIWPTGPWTFVWLCSVCNGVTPPTYPPPPCEQPTVLVLAIVVGVAVHSPPRHACTPLTHPKARGDEPSILIVCQPRKPTTANIPPSATQPCHIGPHPPLPLWKQSPVVGAIVHPNLNTMV